MFRLALRTVFAKKRRFVSTALSITLGIAFLVGTLVFTDTMDRTFDNLFADIYAVAASPSPQSMRCVAWTVSPRPTATWKASPSSWAPTAR
jgi:putative ABC transport system permease protein